MRIRSVLCSILICILVTVAGGCALEGRTFSKSAGLVGGEATSYEFSSAPATSDLTRENARAQDAVTPPALPAAAVDPATPATNPADARKVIYSAAFRVVVADVPGSLAAIRRHAEQLGGYLQAVDGGTITVRVPAARFNDAVAYVERVGEVVSRQLRAQDVTDAMRDLAAHLDNFEKLRQRLQALLAKAEKVEDALKIEAELTRVTEELDRTKGKLRHLESQVAMSDIRVELNAPVTQNPGGVGPRLPFAWVDVLGDGLVAGQVQSTVREAGIFGRGPRFEPPTGFVRYYEDDGHTEAMDAEGVRLRVLRQENVDRAPLSFWSALVRKSLVENRSLAVTREETGKDFYLLEGTREVGGKTLGYLLSLERSNTRVVVFETWGPRELVEQKREALRTSALSIDPK